jgi:MFS family permease
MTPQSRIKWALFAASSLTVMSGAAIAPSLVLLKKIYIDVPHADFLIRMLMSLPALMVLMTAPGVGWLDDRFSKTRVLKVSSLIFSLSGVLALLADSLYFLLGTRILLGLGVSGIMTSITPLAFESFKGPERSKFMGQMESFVQVGGIALLLLAGVMADQHPKAPFVLYTFGFLVWVLCHDSLPRTRPSVDKKMPSLSLPKLLKIQASLIYALIFVLMIAFYFLPTQIPFLLEERGILKGKSIALVIAGSQITGAVTSYYFSVIKQRFNYFQLLALSAFLMSGGYFGVRVSTEVWHFFIAVAVFGAGIGLILPALSLWLMELAEPQFHGRVSGGFSTALFAGQFASPFVAHFLLKEVSLENLFTLTAILLFILSLGLLMMPRILVIPSKQRK